MQGAEGSNAKDKDVGAVVERYLTPSPDRGGWLSYRIRPPADIGCLRSDLVARSGPDGVFMFTIGETLCGRTNQLSKTFRRLCELEGIKVVDREAPNPSRTRTHVFPAIVLSDCSAGQIERLLLQVRGALLAADTLARG